MSLDPAERLEALRREVLGEAATSAPPRQHEPPPQAGHEPQPRPQPEPQHAPEPGPAREARRARLVTGTVEPVDHPGEGPGGHRDSPGWGFEVAIDGARFRVWFGIGLLAVAGYLVLAQAYPGVGFIGSLLLLGTGVALLGLHFSARAAGWALYSGALLTAIGGVRVLAGLLPIRQNGVTAIAIGGAMLAIAWLRHSQTGGYGWQGRVGIAALVFGLVEVGLGLLPGSPGVLDFLLPGLLLLAGVALLMRAARRPGVP